MSGFIKIIKNLLSGILSFFIGLLRGKQAQKIQPESKPAELPGKVTGKKKRRSGYFLELDEAEDMKPAEAKPSAGANGSKTPQPAAAESASPQAKTPQPAAAKSASPQAKAPQPAAAKSAQVELVQTAEGIKAEPAKPNKSKAASANGQQPTETTFAPKYLNPSANTSNGRRRPGPNMNTFLDMARQVKSPS